MIEIKKLKLCQKNPRKITKDDLDKLCDSLINDPGFLKNRPILVNQVDGVLNVYAGNQRVQAAKKLKWKEVPCIIEENLSEELIKQRILKDNRHSGIWDYDILAGDYDLEMLVECGFTPEELHLNLTPQEIESEDKEEKEKKKKECPNCGHEF
jgi:ParB-like chromosome segregation protein Spo0J